VIDAFVELAGAKVPATSRSLLRDRPLAQIQLAQAEGLLRAARAYFYESNDDIWRKGAGTPQVDSNSRALARLASVTAVKLSAQAVDLIYDAAGISAIRTSCAIERCWRDIHAVTQHVILSTGRFEVIGRVLLGLDPGSPII
jgi:alkylation response protein AidB-like acyl-CoA dehydrogenase